MTNIDAKIARVEEIIGYTFTDKVLCAEALQTAGFPQDRLTITGTIHLIRTNSRIAVLGDAVMALVLCEVWFPYRNNQRKNSASHLPVLECAVTPTDSSQNTLPIESSGTSSVKER
jgi:ribonuclease-3